MSDRTIDLHAASRWSISVQALLFPHCVQRIAWFVGFLGACGGGGGGSGDSGVGDAGRDAPADAAVASCPTPTEVPTPPEAELVVAGDVGSTLGIFDPSIVYPADAAAGAMAYSAVPDQETIRTRIAVSTNAGQSWTYAAEANVPEPLSITSTDTTECPGGTCTGKLVSEVSSLIYDADDPDAGRRWKLFAHRYLVGPEVALHYRIGTITVQTAGQPQGPWTAPQKMIGWNGPTTYSSSGVPTSTSTLTGMADCIALTEPGAMWLPGSIQLAVGCVYVDGTPKIRIELLRSTDHATSWIAAGTLVSPADADCLTPGASVNAAELFALDGQVYVSASPSNNAGYHGCLVFPVDDLSTATLRRDAAGKAFVTRAIVPSPTRFAGACTYAAGAGGYAMIVGYLDQARRFRIFRTGVAAP
ncbi:MAG: hypothetical protein WKG01_01980 [Kofleriaceae bacterium]